VAQLIRIERGAEAPLRRWDDRPWRYVEIMVQTATMGGDLVIHDASGCQQVEASVRQAFVFDGTLRHGVTEVFNGERWSLLLGFGPK
jgi:hypothetical protein